MHRGLFFIFLFIGHCVVAQVKEGMFRSPMDVPLLVTAGFGEIRPNHFHSGIDFSTYGKQQAVKAAESGYISRIRISQVGYGNALYINHPNGFTTVYAHLSRFNDVIDAYTKRFQERAKEYEIDLLTDSTELIVTRGQVIAYSGNSGSSTAPHLHFEVRDQLFENTINPFLFGFPNKDVTPPQISIVNILPKEKYGRVNNQSGDLNLPLVYNKSTHKKGISPATKMPVLSGWVGFGFQGGDVIGKPQNLSGIYDVKLKVDSVLIFHSRFDEFSFHETRGVNAYMNYEIKKRTGRKVQQCIVPPNNVIGIYKSHDNHGYFYFDKDKVYEISYQWSDAAGNTTDFTMKVRGKKPDWTVTSSTESADRPEVIPGMAQSLSIKGFEASFETGSLFDTSAIKLIARKINRAYSDLFELGSIYIPINQSIRVRIKPVNVVDSLQSKVLIVRRQGSSQVALSTNREGEWLEASTNEFGDFLVIADTTAPVISYTKPKVRYHKVKRGNHYVKVPIDSGNPKPEGTIRFKVYDTLSGIGSLQAYLNGNWILLVPGDNKNDWEFKFPENLPAGPYSLTIRATDNVGNQGNFVLMMEQPATDTQSPVKP